MKTPTLIPTLLVALLAASACSDDGDDKTVPTEPDIGQDAGEDGDPQLDVAEDTPDELDADVTTDPDANEDTEADTEDSGPDLPPLPLELELTVNEIPEEMNGSTGLYVLTLPTEGFTVDLTFIEGTRPIALDTLEVRVGDVTLVSQPESTEAGARIVVSAEDGLVPAVGVSVCAHLEHDGELVTAPCLTVDIQQRQPTTDPFPEPETWLVVTSRDQFSPDPRTDVQPPRILSAEGADGIPDLDQALDAIGLTSGGENPEADQLTRQRLLDRVRHRTSHFYGLDGQDGVPIVLVFEGDPGAPDPADYAPDGAFSMIALGGDMPEDKQQIESTVGRARIDWNNQERNDDTVLDLGVFVSSIVRQAISHPAGAIVLSPFCPHLGGIPFGLGHFDEQFIPEDAPGPQEPGAHTRKDLYDMALDLLSLALSTTLAHEMGHSLGLVPPGLPPEGLCAGEDVPFVVAVMDTAHIDTPGLNVMQTGAVTNYMEALSNMDNVAFNPLNMAYLRRRLLVVR